MRGATPLDVAAASVMDNNELALVLREPDLEKVISIICAFLYSTAVNSLHYVMNTYISVLRPILQ